MKKFSDDPDSVSAFRPNGPVITEDGGISAFRSGDTSAMRALETIVEPGTVIGGYCVGTMIGRGGIAAVYNAIQVETGEQVALKVLDARFSANSEIVVRFLAEAETLSLFSHPNIVSHLDHGQDEEFVYLAMEHVPGITLDQLVHAIEMHPHHYVHIAHEISKGLTCVHAQGLVHGDIKPSNILVTRPGDVKISDFGAAAKAAIKGSRAGQSKVHGTSSYMAPELFKPMMGVDFRADIYSLAVMFYKIITGKLPGDPYVSPSQEIEGLPDAVDAVIERGMRHNPDERFVTAKEFCDALASSFDSAELVTPVAISADPADISEEDTDEHGMKDSDLPGGRQTAGTVKASKAKQQVGIDWRLVLLCGAVFVVIAVAVIVLKLG